MDYNSLKKGIENRVAEIINNQAAERFDTELEDLVSVYKNLKPYIKDDPMYDTKQKYMGLFLLSTKLKAKTVC